MNPFVNGRLSAAGKRVLRWHGRLRRFHCTTGFSRELINAAKEDARLQGLVDAYRRDGHRIAQINPIVKTSTAQYIKDLDPQTHSLKPTEKVSGHTVEVVVGHLRDAYCGPMGVEFMHLVRVPVVTSQGDYSL